MPALLAHIESIRRIEAAESLNHFCEMFVAARGDQAAFRRVMDTLTRDSGLNTRRHGDINDLLAAGLAGPG